MDTTFEPIKLEDCLVLFGDEIQDNASIVTNSYMQVPCVFLTYDMQQGIDDTLKVGGSMTKNLYFKKLNQAIELKNIDITQYDIKYSKVVVANPTVEGLQKKYNKNLLIKDNNGKYSFYYHSKKLLVSIDNNKDLVNTLNKIVFPDKEIVNITPYSVNNKDLAYKLFNVLKSELELEAPSAPEKDTIFTFIHKGKVGYTTKKLNGRMVITEIECDTSDKIYLLKNDILEIASKNSHIDIKNVEIVELIESYRNPNKIDEVLKVIDQQEEFFAGTNKDTFTAKNQKVKMVKEEGRLDWIEGNSVEDCKELTKKFKQRPDVAVIVSDQVSDEELAKISYLFSYEDENKNTYCLRVYRTKEAKGSGFSYDN